MATPYLQLLQSHMENLGDGVFRRRRNESYILLKVFLTFQLSSFTSLQVSKEGSFPFIQNLVVTI